MKATCFVKTTELKLCFIKLIANLCSVQSNIRRNTPSPVEIHSPPHRLSTTPEDLNYGIYVITWGIGYKYNSNQSILDTI
ncbi:hypothetical protein T12_639 [Trichinella patagoniensis]|uniref:Uncharacterized protein n=1 Tax=Trichinella patagoniensis TaxID=990121 RepID=A0A0V0ZRF3_9BILA|nr:hypothetical protein T12_639 [Trichinella patagoniensis]